MFNKDFYPTPNEVITLMVNDLSLANKNVLEPSAGKGNIVSYLQGLGASVQACENHPELRGFVSNMCTLIKDDFLELSASEASHFDFIIMNPPFSDQDKHIEHAWKIAPNGCIIVSLCNSAMFERTHWTRTISRVSKLIDEHGTKQDLGNVFKESERTTDVNVSLIRLYKPAFEEDDFSNYFDLDEEYVNYDSGIMAYSVVQDMVSRYVDSVRKFDEVEEIAKRINENISTITSGNAIEFGAFKLDYNDRRRLHKEDFIVELQKKAWENVFKKMNMDKYLTENVKSDINKFVQQQKNIPFSVNNIYKMLDMVIQTNGQRMDKVLEEVFDTITHHYHDNRYNLEGWKTNSHYLVNEKIILPYITSNEWGSFRVRYSSQGNVGEIEDFCKALCYVEGVDYDSIGGLYLFVNKNEQEWGKWFDWGFFECKGFKKGTMHFKFKDRSVWARFNQRIAKIKGYPLPEKI